MVERAEVVLGEMGRIERGLFGVQGEGDGEGMGGSSGVGGVSRLELLQLEYHQLLQAVTLLSTTHLFGALPLPLSTTSTSTSSTTTNANPGSEGEAALPSIVELTTWAESRAAIEFGRREGVRGASRAVFDVLRSGR